MTKTQLDFIESLVKVTVERTKEYKLKEIVDIDLIGFDRYKILANIEDESDCLRCEYEICFMQDSFTVIEGGIIWN